LELLQVYKSSQKLELDFEQININEADFDKAMERMVPSTHRIQDQFQSPLVPRLRPLLSNVVANICTKIDAANWQKEGTFRPRMLIRGRPGQSLATHIGPAVLHHLEKFPCHKLDIPSLYSNSARSAEEAMFHIIHEAKRTVPSVLYIPHFLKLWQKVMADPQRVAFLALMSDIQPTAPLLVLAFVEEEDEDQDDDILDKMFDPEEEVVTITNPSVEQRREFFRPVFEAAKQPPEIAEEGVGEQGTFLEPLNVLPMPESRELTEKEEKRLRRKEDGLRRELRIFLRDIWQKSNREQKFFMFRTPVDIEEVCCTNNYE
jgi:SpoVK/Ycf46/Vps4 family AAA+-type ATPase